MIFYLENGDRFHVHYTNSEIVFLMYSDVTGGPKLTDTRWKLIKKFEVGHIEKILTYLKSDRKGDKEIGRKFLEDTMKVRIIGEIIGYNDRDLGKESDSG